MIRNVAILWDDLLNAFNNMQQDRIYFLDKLTGEIFFVKSDIDDSFWQQIENNQERFLEIPSIDRIEERKIMTGFIAKQEDTELRELLAHAISGGPPYAKPSDILSFFPEEEVELAELRDSFMSDRVKNWLEENNILSMSTNLRAVN